MKRLILTLALCLCASSVWAIPRHTGPTKQTVWSYNPSQGQPIRTVGTYWIGHNLIITVTVQDAITHCKTITTTYYAFWHKVAETVATECL